MLLASTISKELQVIVIGTGFSGLCMGIKLKQAGIENFTILERAGEVGGVWRENTYPGAACDIPAELYSFSFEMKTDWSRRYPPQPEIQQYMQFCADKYGLIPHIRFNTEVAGADYDQAAGQWSVTTGSGEVLKARVLISGVGQLSRPAVPELPGIDQFSGEVFHSAQWNPDFNAAGRRIAVIGTGASAIQFIPEIARTAAQVDVYQRTPPYVMPKPDREYSDRDRWMMQHLPGYKELNRALWYRAGETSTGAFNDGSRLAKLYQWVTLNYMRRHVKDPELRRKLTPDYPVGCKRVLFSHNYFEALAQSNVDVVVDPVQAVTASGIRSASGETRAYDTIIYGTGFRATEFLAPMRITGAGGRELGAVWADGAEAYKGVAVHGFPNLFLLYGPNTNLGSNSIIFMIECQVGYILQALQQLRDGGLRAVDVKAAAMRDYNADIQEKLRHSVWSAGCSSWYHTATGKVTNNWPGYTRDYQLQMSVLDHENFDWQASA